jgi:Flp pilus assembly protein TadG
VSAIRRADRERGRENGSSSAEFVLLMPVFLTVLVFIAAVGRIATASSQVEGAAREAARAASLERSAPAARAAAETAVRANLRGEGVTCGAVVVTVRTSRFRAGGNVRVDVRCTASLRGLGLSGFPGSRTLTGSAVAPLEQFRGMS